MGTIYKMAEEVVTWLGPAGGHSDYAIQMLKLLSNVYCKKRSKPLRFAGGSEWPTLSYSIEWAHFDTFFAFPYWQRAWIIQEVSMGHSVKVVWGHQTLSCDAVSEAVEQ